MSLTKVTRSIPHIWHYSPSPLANRCSNLSVIITKQIKLELQLHRYIHGTGISYFQVLTALTSVTTGLVGETVSFKNQ